MLLAPFALSRFELKTLDRMKFLHFAMLAGFSLAFFWGVDAYMTFELVLAWMLGSFLGASASYGF